MTPIDTYRAGIRYNIVPSHVIICTYIVYKVYCNITIDLIFLARPISKFRLNLSVHISGSFPYNLSIWVAPRRRSYVKVRTKQSALLKVSLPPNMVVTLYLMFNVHPRAL